jgi:hypothetical protein
MHHFDAEAGAFPISKKNCHFDHSQQPNYSSVTKMHQNKICT